MKRTVTTSLIACCLALSMTVSAEERPFCKGSARVIGACFSVHGRIIVANGIPYRLWVIGTHRVLAPDAVPQKVENLLEMDRVHPMSVSVFGDYEVCPLEKERPGWIRAVCIEGASHLVATDWQGKIIKRQR